MAVGHQEARGQWSENVPNLVVVEGLEAQTPPLAGLLGVVLFLGQAAEALVDVQALLGELAEHGVPIPQVVVGQKQLREPHAVMVVVMVEEGQVMATLARREAHLEGVAAVAIIRIAMAA